MTKRTRLAIGIGIIFVALGFLVYTGISRSATYYMTVSEFRAKGTSLVGRSVRVTGKLDGSSVKWDSSNILLTFDLSDGQNRMSATYHGIRPDGMDDGRDIVVEGRLDQKGAFEVKNILVKCPSKYESQSATGS